MFAPQKLNRGIVVSRLRDATSLASHPCKKRKDGAPSEFALHAKIKNKGGPPAEFINGAIAMWRNYQAMRDANFIGIDKYFHCMGSCQAASQGPGGYAAAVVIGELREDYGFWRGDPLWDSLEDTRANYCGRKGAPYCRQRCARYLVRGFTPKD
jgi:hypothetical protein